MELPEFKRELPPELRLDDEAAGLEILKDLTREELANVPGDTIYWQCKIKLCKHFTKALDYGVAPFFFHKRFGWFDQRRQLFFCGKHYKRFKAAIDRGDWENVPLKRLANGGIPWGGDETVTPNIIW
jgi:hypothetical protein